MLRARESSSPRKTPGKTSETSIVFGKSERPVATTLAPAARAAAGEISGSGTARASTIGSVAMEDERDVHRVREVGASGSDNFGASSTGGGRRDLRLRHGQGKHYWIRRHGRRARRPSCSGSRSVR